ncbi:hypothetical protein JCM11251_005803 [Rhodosporidiobolus azoricus]
MPATLRPAASKQILNLDAVTTWCAPPADYPEAWADCWGQLNGAVSGGIPHLAHLVDSQERIPHLWREEWARVWRWVKGWVEDGGEREEKALLLFGQPGIGKSRNLRGLLLALMENRILTVLGTQSGTTATVFCDAGAYTMSWNDVVALKIVGPGVVLVDSTAGPYELQSHFGLIQRNLLTVLATSPDSRRWECVRELYHEVAYWVQDLWSPPEVLDLLRLRVQYVSGGLQLKDAARVSLNVLCSPSDPFSATASLLWPNVVADSAAEALSPDEIIAQFIASSVSVPPSPAAPLPASRAIAPSPAAAPASALSPSSASSTSLATTPAPLPCDTRTDEQYLHPLEIFYHLGPTVRYAVRKRQRLEGRVFESVYGTAGERDIVLQARAALRAVASGTVEEQDSLGAFYRLFFVVPKRGAQQPCLVGPSYELIVPTATLRNLLRRALKELVSSEQRALLRASGQCQTLRWLHHEFAAEDSDQTENTQLA